MAFCNDLSGAPVHDLCGQAARMPDGGTEWHRNTMTYAALVDVVAGRWPAATRWLRSALSGRSNRLGVPIAVWRASTT